MSIRPDDVVLTHNPVKSERAFAGPVHEQPIGALADFNQ